MSDTRPHQARSKGITLIELLVAVAIMAILTVESFPAISRSRQASAIERLATDGEQIFQSLARYQSDHGRLPYPGVGDGEGLNLRTLAPLTTAGYLVSPDAILARLSDHRVLAYDTPGLPGREGFWLILVDAKRPELQVLVASTDQFPLAPDTFIEGIYLIRGTTLEKLRDAPQPLVATDPSDETQHG